MVARSRSNRQLKHMISGEDSGVITGTGREIMSTDRNLRLHLLHLILNPHIF